MVKQDGRAESHCSRTRKTKKERETDLEVWDEIREKRRGEGTYIMNYTNRNR